jgi:hypothetical protein
LPFSRDGGIRDLAMSVVRALARVVSALAVVAVGISVAKGADPPPKPAPAPAPAAAAAPATPVAAAPAPEGGAPAQARFVIRVEKGFIDDPFDIDVEDGALAVLLTDAASFARLDIIDLGTGKPRRTVDVGDPQRLFERVIFAGAGKGLVLVSRDAGSGKRSAQYYDASGKPAGLVGPFTDFGVATRAGETFLVAWSKTAGATGDTCSVARYRLDGLGKLGKAAVYAVNKARELKKPPLKNIEWQDGYAQLVGARPGEFDKTKDMRVPDRAAVLDTLTGSFTFEAEIGDVYGWAAASELRRKLPGRSLFAVFSSDAKVLELVDFLGRHGPMALPVPLRLYDPTTLQEHQDWVAGTLQFGLAIDPLNPDALARRKKDPSFLDLYAARPEETKSAAGGGKEPLRLEVRRLLRAPMDDKPVGWVVRAPYAGILRKHKNFSRGGSALELYDLPK